MKTQNHSSPERNVHRGMRDLVVDTTGVSWVDGENGRLYYRGISIDEIAKNSTFEEAAFLLLCGQLPNQHQLESFSWKLRQMMAHVPEKILRIIQELPKSASPMLALQSAMACLACVYPHHIFSDESLLERAMRVIAQAPAILAAAYRHQLGLPLLQARSDYSYAENFLMLILGRRPSAQQVRQFETALIVQMDHGYNPSTFTARTVASTLADIYSAASAAVGALSGPLHGGASELVSEMLEEIRHFGNPERYVDKVLSENGRIMGMGHRVYQTTDPRAIILESVLEEMTPPEEINADYFLLKRAAVSAREHFEKKNKPVFVNVDFWTGALYDRLGLKPSLYPGLFAVARMVGWMAHIIELRQDNRLYRPSLQYIGPVGARYIPIEKR